MYIHRAVASYLDVVWPKSCGRKGTAARGVWGHAPPGNLLLRPFFAKNICEYLVRGMVGVCEYVPAAIIYLLCLCTCKGVKQFILSICQVSNWCSEPNEQGEWGG